MADTLTTVAGKLRAGTTQAQAWIECGVRQQNADVRGYLAMAALYLVAAVGLKTIPFLGNLLIVLLSPFALASALMTLDQERSARPATLSPSRPGPPADLIENYLRAPARRLARVHADEHRLLSTVQLGIVMLSLVLLVAIIEYLTTGGSVMRAIGGYGTHWPPLWVAFSWLLALTLKLILWMALLYATPRTILDHTEPLSALVDSFRVCYQHRYALAMYTLAALVPYALIAGGFAVSHPLGYLLLFLAGTPALSLFVASLYCSYRQLFPIRQ